MAGNESDHQRHKSGSSSTGAAVHRYNIDNAAATRTAGLKRASAATSTRPGPETRAPLPAPRTQVATGCQTAAPFFGVYPVAPTFMTSFPLLSQNTSPIPPSQKQEAHAQLERLWRHQTCGEPLERPIRWQLQQADLSSPLGRRVTEQMLEHLVNYQVRYDELLRQANGMILEADFSSDSTLYHSYTAVSAVSAWLDAVSRAEATLEADLLDFQMLHLERYLFLYGPYVFTDDGDLNLEALPRDFWWEAAERKRRWEQAFRAIPGNEHGKVTAPGPMPEKLQDLYRLILEDPAPTTSTSYGTIAAPNYCSSSSYLPLWQYVSFDATGPGVWSPSSPFNTVCADDDGVGVGKQTDPLLYTRQRALEDLRTLTHRIPPRYAHLVPHLRIAIGSFLEANYYGFYEDCVALADETTVPPAPISHNSPSTPRPEHPVVTREGTGASGGSSGNILPAKHDGASSSGSSIGDSVMRGTVAITTVSAVGDRSSSPPDSAYHSMGEAASVSSIPNQNDISFRGTRTSDPGAGMADFLPTTGPEDPPRSELGPHAAEAGGDVASKCSDDDEDKWLAL